MHLKKLRISGFKSFCDACDFLIEPGLTGIVGPNGCGKSNLVEAMRWVMGESSYKNMRASGMEDVIFSGSGARAPRNLAEVTLTLDNADRGAPAAFNDMDVIEVARAIARGEGSTYRINAREVRARDVQLLFADAATGARSTALVRQGQIAEIIAAKPAQRRRILEDAAGIAGLYTRRQEAEARLKATEDNLARVADVLQQIAGQAESLRKQAKTAARYRTLVDAIEQKEALLLLVDITHAQGRVAKAKDALEECERAVLAHGQRQATCARDEAVLATSLDALRAREQEAQHTLQGLVAAKSMLEAEARRTIERLADVTRRLEQAHEDKARDGALLMDAEQFLARLAAEQEALKAEEMTARARHEALAARARDAQDALKHKEAQFVEAQGQLAALRAEHHNVARALGEARKRAARDDADLAALVEKQDRLRKAIAEKTQANALAVDTGALEANLHAAEADFALAEDAVKSLEREEQAQRAPLDAARTRAHSLKTEITTLSNLLFGNKDAKTSGGKTRQDSPLAWQNVLAAAKVEKGYELAFARAFGDTLEACFDAGAPAHWLCMPQEPTLAPLPAGAEPLGAFVVAPPALARALAQIGVVSHEHGARLQAALCPGQSLVARSGALWRFDGYVARAEADSPAARHLMEKNRLEDLRAEAVHAEAAALQHEAEAARIHDALKAARAKAQSLQNAVRLAMRALEEARAARARFEASLNAQQREEAALEGQCLAKQQAHAQSLEDVVALEAAQRTLASFEELELEVAKNRALAEEARRLFADAAAMQQGFAREQEQRQRRLNAIAGERADWQKRLDKAHAHRDELDARIAALGAQAQALETQPDAFVHKRGALLLDVAAAEKAQTAAVEARMAQDRALQDARRTAKEALEALSVAREARARALSASEGESAALAALVRKIAEDRQATPDALVARAGLGAHTGEADLPGRGTIDADLKHLREERARMGAVNLRADEELAAMMEQHDSLLAERDDLDQATKRLRGAISNLNREGRERLLEAFAKVNGHFEALFTRLFGGGAAQLELSEADDPLEAGLEILARPPGKRPQTMTLLSGGEQALTALSLIFAVFLTNPSPVCVLDEVDAPLDDANVERFCALLDTMREDTQTRFLVITHNPVTMARMDRLYGVTMAERGVSQLVSVDLEMAERFLDAG